MHRIEILQREMSILKRGLDLDPHALRTFVCIFNPNDLLSFMQILPLYLILANLYYQLKSDSRRVKVFLRCLILEIKLVNLDIDL